MPLLAYRVIVVRVDEGDSWQAPYAKSPVAYNGGMYCEAYCVCAVHVIPARCLKRPFSGDLLGYCPLIAKALSCCGNDSAHMVTILRPPWCVLRSLLNPIRPAHK